jgi:hypothetical protein
MFDEILKMVKDHLGNNPQITAAIPADQQDAVHNEVAAHVTNVLKNQAAAEGGAGGLLSKLQGALTSGNPVVNAIEGSLVSSLGSKFGLGPMVTGAIAGSLPGLLQKFAKKANDPNDSSITKESINQSLPTSVDDAATTVMNKV